MSPGQPTFAAALAADTALTCACRGERSEFTSGADLARQALRLMWESDAFAAQVLYRAGVALRARRVPALPRLTRRLALSLAQVSIGPDVVIEPGLYLPHGQVVIAGDVEIGSNTRIRPWVTIAADEAGARGPRIGRGVGIGTGASVTGGVRVGNRATVGANAAVVDDVATEATVVGIPARAVGAGAAGSAARQ